ncbi:MAG: hypothetical protein EBU90_26340 [Proteobacteria bacterium]|nr:hypothetical protein [Pseudomonadota bacterium]
MPTLSAYITNTSVTDRGIPISEFTNYQYNTGGSVWYNRPGTSSPVVINIDPIDPLKKYFIMIRPTTINNIAGSESSLIYNQLLTPINSNANSIINYNLGPGYCLINSASFNVAAIRSAYNLSNNVVINSVSSIDTNKFTTAVQLNSTVARFLGVNSVMSLGPAGITIFKDLSTGATYTLSTTFVDTLTTYSYNIYQRSKGVIYFSVFINTGPFLCQRSSSGGDSTATDWITVSKNIFSDNNGYLSAYYDPLSSDIATYRITGFCYP